LFASEGRQSGGKHERDRLWRDLDLGIEHRLTKPRLPLPKWIAI